MNKTAKILLIVFLLNVFLTWPTAPAKAAGASLFLSPANSTRYVGDKFNIFVYVGATVASNTFDVYLSTASSNLSFVGISSGGSICILFPEQPSYTETTARFRCGLPTPGYTGGNGYIGAVTIRANSPGSGQIRIDANSKVLANDGSGTNILGSRGVANVNVQPPPTSAPSISSPTHPDQAAWYKNKNVTFNWSGNGNNFSYSLDQNPDTTPDQNSEGSGTNKTFTDLSDGFWYFHVIVRGSSGNWSPANHFKVQIDTTPPAEFKPEAEPKANATVRPIIAFNTTDLGSGVDYYEVKVDDGKWERAAQPYKLSKISSGKHRIYVKAIDKAGNEQVGSVDITVAEIPSPTILEPSNGAILPYINQLKVIGKSLPNSQVKLFLDGKEIATVKTDKNGRFEFTYKELLAKGQHELYAVAINPDQIESGKSALVKFEIDPQAYLIFGQIIPTSYIFVSFTFTIILILLGLIFFFIKDRKLRNKAKEIIEQLEKEVEKELEGEKVSKKTKEKIEDEFEEAEKKV